MKSCKVTIITVCRNSASTIVDSINSVLNLLYLNIEYIIIDGGSTDGTIDIINSYGDRISKFITEPDNGIYDAINKGIKLANGDIVGILNSDDVFCNEDVITRIIKEFDESEIDAIYGDVRFVDPKSKKVVRYYSSENFSSDKFRYGFMPAHPSFYVKRELFERYGYYKTDYKIAADFELLLRFIHTHKISTRYLPSPFVNMRTGGVSNRSVISNYILNREILRACRENGLKTNYFNIYSKYLRKIFEYINLNRHN